MLKKVTSHKSETFFTQSLSLEYMDQHYRQEWEYLANHCLEPNIFYSPAFLMALRNHLLPHQKITILATWRRTDRMLPQLIGLFPFTSHNFIWGRPAKLLRALVHPYITSSTPLVHRDYAEQSVIQFLDELEVNKQYKAVNMAFMPTEGAFFGLLNHEIQFRDRAVTILDSYQRAALSSTLDGKGYLAAMRKSRSKDLGKRQRQLEKLGNVTHFCLSKPEELDEALGIFLDLEASGWKGRKRTALKSSPQGCAFAQDALRLSKGNISCRYDFMAVDGKIIAATLTLIHDNIAWVYKSAYDENYARYAPSIQAYAALTKKLLADDGIVLADSSSLPGNVIESLWQERCTISDILFATGDDVSPGHIRWLAKSHQLYHQARQSLKDLILKAKKTMAR